MIHDFGVDVTDHGNGYSVTVVVTGDFDAAQAPEFERRTAALPASIGALAVDVSGASVIDSSALAALVRLRRRCDDAGIAFTTLVGRPFQRALMNLTGLTEVLNVRPSG